MTPQDFLTYLNIILLVGLALGGIYAFRNGNGKAALEIQKTVTNGLKDEVSTLRRKVDDLQQERSTQDRVIATIRYALRQYSGLKIIIAGDFVTIQDASGKSMSTPVQSRAPVKPIIPVDDNDDSDVS